jgi:AmmeMemoRadiSam system protein B
MATMVREPAVAGRFYPGQRESLLREVHSYVDLPGEKVAALGCVAPHAGYMYSGHVAGAVYARLDLPARFIILCPNHTGMGKPLSVMSEGSWRTPLGDVRIDTELATALKKNCHLLEEDVLAHRAEHALEVQLPFLQVLRKDFAFVPITVGVGVYQPLHILGEAMGQTVAALGERVTIIASSDMNHYENDRLTREKDHRAIDKVLTLDARGLFEIVTRENISMCGFGPTVAMLTAARILGATTAELVKYATSGDVSGDRDMVVGYAGVIVR